MVALGSELEPNGNDRGRRCHVVLLFSDLSGYTAMSEQCDPENVAELLELMKAQAVPIVERHGGFVNQFYGDGFLAVFGLASPQEDDVRHATEAAVELHAAIGNLALDFSLPLGMQPRLHSGIHAGLIFARKTSFLHGRYELIGDAVNTAARLCAAATADEILASQETLEGVKAFFQVRAVSPLQLKGKEEPVPVYQVLSRSAVQTRFEASTERGLTQFIGRLEELAHLEHALMQACLGRGRVVYVCGDAGMGKTRLLHQFQRTLVAPVASVLKGRCESAARIAPFEPFQQIVRQLFGLKAHASRAEALVELEAGLVELQIELQQHLQTLSQLLFLEDGSAPSGRLIASQPTIRLAVTDVVLAVCRSRPLVLFLDDWHWADDASWQVLRDLANHVHNNPLLIVIGSRFADPPSLADTQKDLVSLSPFTHSESDVAAQSWLSRTLDAPARRALLERAGGNPLFLEELCLSWSVESPFRGAAPESSRIPSTLHGLVESRIQRLPPHHAEVARMAAVLGTEFEIEQLQQVSGFSDALSVLEDLARYDLIYATDTPGRFRYKHGITRDVAYNSVRLGERRRLHSLVAQTIEQGQPAESLSEHFETLAYHFAGADEHAQAADYAERAGDKAAMASALDRVRHQYRAALLELDRLKQTPELRRRWLTLVGKWAAACVYSPSEEQLVLLERAKTYAALEGDQAATAHTNYWIGWIHYALGEQETSIRAFEAALALAENSGDERLRGQLLANLGQSHAAASNYQEATRRLDDAARAKRGRAPSGSGAVPVGFAYALGTKGLILGDVGDFPAAYRTFEQSLLPVRGRAHAIEGSLLGLLGMVQLWQGEWQACLETSEKARAIADIVGEPYVMAIGQAVHGYGRYMLTRDRAGLEELREAKVWLERRKIRLYLSFCAASLAELALMAGEVDLASENAAFAVERATHGDRLGECLAHRILSECAAQNGEHALALTELDIARNTAMQRGSRRDLALTQYLDAKLHVARGESELARPKFAQAEDELKALSMRWHASRVAADAS